jgi:hypothetical protein
LDAAALRWPLSISVRVSLSGDKVSETKALGRLRPTMFDFAIEALAVRRKERKGFPPKNCCFWGTTFSSIMTAHGQTPFPKFAARNDMA